MSSRPATDPETEAVSLPTDPHQQLVLVHVLRNGGAITLAELSRRIATSDGDGPTESRDPAARRRVYDTVSVVDLPALIDRGLLEDDDGVIVATEELEALVDQRATAVDDDGRWFRRFAAAALLLGCLVLAAAAGTIPAKAPIFGLLTVLGVLSLIVLPLSKHLGSGTFS